VALSPKLPVCFPHFIHPEKLKILDISRDPDKSPFALFPACYEASRLEMPITLSSYSFSIFFL